MKLFDRIRCRLGWHDWGPSDGVRCARCLHFRPHRHQWIPSGCDEDVCSVCSESRQSPEPRHQWTGCVCVKCGKKRDEAHEWGPGDTRCRRCNAVRSSRLDRTDQGEVFLVLREAEIPDAGARERSWLDARRELKRSPGEAIKWVRCPRRWGESRTTGEVFTVEDLERPLPFTCSCMEGSLRYLKCPACGKTVDRAGLYRLALERLPVHPAASCSGAGMSHEECVASLLKPPKSDWGEDSVECSENALTFRYRSLGMDHVMTVSRVGDDAYACHIQSFLDD